MEKEKRERHIFLSILLLLVVFTSIGNFIVNILFQENNLDFILSLISNLILTIFTIFFAISEITNTSKKKFTIYVSSIIFIVYLSFSILNTTNLLPIKQIKKVEDFSNKSLTEVIKWSEANHIELNQIYEYSEIVDEYKIISQSAPKDTLIKNVKKLTIVISEGPNPDKEIVIPNMVGWDVNKVIKCVNQYHLNNIKVNYEESDKIRNTLTSQDKSGSIKRSDEINLTFSLGEEEITETKLIDLSNKPLFEAEIFFKQNKLNYEITYDFSNYVKRGHVVKTDKEIGSILTSDNKVIMTISKGREIKVPDLKKYSIVKITNWIIDNKLRLEFSDKYDDQIKPNNVISVNYNKGDIIEEKTVIKVVLSKGKLVMNRFNNLDEFKEWANKYGINYEEKYVFDSEVKAGEVISYSHKVGDTIKNDDTITVTISQGEKTKVPNVVGKSKEDAVKLLEKAKLKYNFVYENNTKEKNTVLKQSLNSGNEVAKETTITLTLSNGKEPTTNNKSYNNNSNNNSTTKNNTNNHSNDIQTDTCDKSVTGKIYIYPNLVESGSASTTCASIKAAYPKFKFTCSYQTGTGLASGLLINASEIDDKSFNYCDTITLKISQN